MRHLTLSFVFLALVMCSSLLHAQTINWEKTFRSADDGQAVAALADGGYIVAGGYNHAAVVRTAANGDSLWGRSVNMFTLDIKAVIGGYILSGYQNSHPYVLKIDNNGATVWEHFIGGPTAYDHAAGIIATSDALYITGGLYNNNQTYSLFLTKLSLAGDSIWMTTLAPHTTTSGRAVTNTDAYGIAKTSDGFIVSGTADSEVYLAKFDLNGNKVWDHSYPGVHSTSDMDQAFSVQVTADGGYIACGVIAHSNTSGTTTIDLLKTTSDGTLSWRRSLGASGDVGRHVVVDPDGYVLAVGENNSGHLIKTDLQGQVIWDKPLGASWTNGLDKAQNGTYAVAGTSADGTAMYLGNVSGGTTPPPPDKQTYNYTYQNQGVYQFHTNATNGWVGAGAGKISSVGTSVIMVNGGIDFYTTDFTIDTTRASSTGSVRFHGTGSMDIRHSPLTSAQSTFGSGAFSGTISGSDITFDSAMTDDLSLAGLALSLNSVSPGPFPSASSVRGTGSVQGLGFWSCNSSNAQVNFSTIVFNPTTIDLPTIGDIQVGPGDCIKQVTTTYSPSSDILTLRGNFVSSVLFPSGVLAATSIDKGRIGIIVLQQPNNNIQLGANTQYQLDSLFGLLTYDYYPIITFLLPIGPKALIAGHLHEDLGQTKLYEVDLTTAYFTLPPHLVDYNDNYRAFRTGNDYQIIGNANIDLTWGGGLSTTKLKGGLGTLQAGLLPNTSNYIFNGDFGRIFVQKPDGLFYSRDANGQWSLTGNASGTATMPDLSNVSGLGVLAQLATALYPQGSKFNAFAYLNDSLAVLHLFATKKSQVIGAPSAFQVRLDLSKPSSDPGFLSMTTISPLAGVFDVFAGTNGKHNAPVSIKVDTLRIPIGVTGAYIKLKGIGNPPTASLKDPNGNQITQSLPDSSALLVAVGSHERWWVLDHPTQGIWLINGSGSSGDSLITYIIKDPEPFTITATQTNRTVNVKWTNTGVPNNKISIYITGDTVSGSRQIVARANRSDGSVSFNLTDNMPECKYYVYAVSEGAGSTQEAIANSPLSNAKSILASPNGINAKYSAKDTGVVLTWNKSTDPNIIGYAVRLTGNGVDSTVGTPYGFQTRTAFRLKKADGMYVSMLSYDSLGRRGCWSDPVALSSSAVSQRPIVPEGISMLVLPNPSQGRTSLKFTLHQASEVSVAIFDEAGREVQTLPVTRFGTGSFEMNLATESLRSGRYTVMLRAGDNVSTSSFVVIK